MSDERKFKVGDLVTIKGFYFIVGYSSIADGEPGVISEVLRHDPTQNKFVNLFFDYAVLVGDDEFFVFEEEVTAFDPEFNPCDSCYCDPCDCDWGCCEP
tara:strand:+ start:2664 stop:2960 length:297 start_codon:yes stop_codon:yes gene_type:complete